MKLKIGYNGQSVEYKVKKCQNYDHIIQLIKDHMNAFDNGEKLEDSNIFQLTKWEKHPSKTNNL